MLCMSETIEPTAFHATSIFLKLKNATSFIEVSRHKNYNRRFSCVEKNMKKVPLPAKTSTINFENIRAYLYKN